MSYDEHLISMAGGDGEPKPLDLDAIQARGDAASPGPWEADSAVRGDCVVWGPNGKFLMNQQAAPHWVDAPGDQKRAVSFDVDKRDGEFIAHARTDVPALLALVRKQHAALDELMYVANHKAADTQVGRWWAEVIRGPIIEHLGSEAASKMGTALTATDQQ